MRILRNRDLNVQSNNNNNLEERKQNACGGEMVPTKRHVSHSTKEPDPKKRAFGNLIVEGSPSIPTLCNFVIDSTKRKSTEKAAKSTGTSIQKRPSAIAYHDHDEPQKENNDHNGNELHDLPDPIEICDFDKENEHDVFSVSTYAKDIFAYYKHQEPLFAVGNYMARKQPKITAEIRAQLINWLVEVQEVFELNHETLYLAVKLFDLFLDRVPNVKLQSLQLVASAAVFIASKFDERSPPLVEDLISVSQDNFDSDSLFSAECRILKAVNFNLGSPLSYRFLRRYARISKVDMATLTLARYILETSLMFFDFCRVSESLIAAASLLLARRMKNLGGWTQELRFESGYQLEEIEPLMWALNHMIIKRDEEFDRLDVVFKKYSHKIFYEVALVESLEDRLNGQPIKPPPRNI